MSPNFQRIIGLSNEADGKPAVISVTTAGKLLQVTDPIADRAGVIIYNTDSTNALYIDITQKNNTLVPASAQCLIKLAAGESTTLMIGPKVNIWASSSTGTVVACMREFA